MLSLSTGVLTLILLAQVAMALSYEQEIFASFHTSAPRVKVPDHNHAYFAQVEMHDQLFWIRDLAIHPDPPRLNEHNIVLLGGWIKEEYPGLEDAILKVSGGCPEYGEYEKRIADISKPVVRHFSSYGEGYDYGGPLRRQENGIFFDQFWLWLWPEPIKRNCTLEATARLPDERILFSFAMDFKIQWPPSPCD